MRATQPKENLAITAPAATGLIGVAMQREIAEVQAAIIGAHMKPRNRAACIEAIKNECMRPELAVKACYAYAKGGTDIRGPSIRLAEVMAQNWKNMDFGRRELDRREDETTVEAFCWDIENNVRQRIVFQVPHVRYSKEKGNVVLTDPREIYENTANMGARRMRACILGVIPREVQDMAVEQCRLTLENHIKVTPELIKRLIEKFGEFQVTKEQIEARIQRKTEAMLPAQMYDLGGIYNSLRDGMSEPDDWFKAGKEPEKGTLKVEDLKPGKTEAPADASQAASPPAAAADQAPASSASQTPPPQAKGKDKSKTKSGSLPGMDPFAGKGTGNREAGGNPSYSDKEPDPYKTGELNSEGNGPGQKG